MVRAFALLLTVALVAYSSAASTAVDESIQDIITLVKCLSAEAPEAVTFVEDGVSTVETAVSDVTTLDSEFEACGNNIICKSKLAVSAVKDIITLKDDVATLVSQGEALAAVIETCKSSS